MAQQCVLQHGVTVKCVCHAAAAVAAEIAMTTLLLHLKCACCCFPESR
jgi:hypothetical protein